MQLKTAGILIKQLCIGDVIRLSNLLDTRRKNLEKSLKEVLPPNLRERFGCYEVTSNLVYNGGCHLLIFSGVGTYIPKSRQKEYCNRARREIQPVIEAWSQFGVVLEKVLFCPVNAGEVTARFKVK